MNKEEALKDLINLSIITRRFTDTLEEFKNKYENHEEEFTELMKSDPKFKETAKEMEALQKIMGDE